MFGAQRDCLEKMAARVWGAYLDSPMVKSGVFALPEAEQQS
jgi:hypothetical protein